MLEGVLLQMISHLKAESWEGGWGLGAWGSAVRGIWSTMKSKSNSHLPSLSFMTCFPFIFKNSSRQTDILKLLEFYFAWCLQRCRSNEALLHKFTQFSMFSMKWRPRLALFITVNVFPQTNLGTLSCLLKIIICPFVLESTTFCICFSFLYSCCDTCNVIDDTTLHVCCLQGPPKGYVNGLFYVVFFYRRT